MRMIELVRKLEEMKQCEVIATKPESNHRDDELKFTALCKFDFRKHQYVVWYAVYDEDGLSTYSGVYCETFEEAMQAFNEA